MLETDSRLSQKVEIREPSEQLPVILANIRKQTGVHLEVAAPFQDAALVIRFDGTVAEWMKTVSQFFATSTANHPRWYRYGSEGKYRWRLEDDLSSREQLTQLETERKRVTNARFQQLIDSRYYDNEQWKEWEKRDPAVATATRAAVQRAGRGAQVLWRFFDLPEETRKRVLTGEWVTFRADQLATLAGHPDADQFIQEWLGEGQPVAPDRNSLVTFYVDGHNERRGFYVRLDYSGPAQGTSTTTGVRLDQLFYEGSETVVGAGVGASRQRRWRDHLGMDALPSLLKVAADSAVKAEAEAEISDLPYYRQPIYDAANRFNVNLIAEDYGWQWRGAVASGEQTVDKVLDQICGDAGDPMLENSGNGYFWRYRAGSYLLRSLDWPEDAKQAVSCALVRRWKASRAKHGLLQIDDLAAMAQLSSRSIPILTAWFPEAGRLRFVQEPLRWYSLAVPAAREQVRSPNGASLGELGVNLSGLEGYADRDTDSMWSMLLQGADTSRYYLSIVYGHREDAGTGIRKLGIGIVIHELGENGLPQKRKMVVIPLTPA